MCQPIDFVDQKQRVPIDCAAELLGIATKKSGAQLRGICPVCKDGDYLASLASGLVSVVRKILTVYQRLSVGFLWCRFEYKFALRCVIKQRVRCCFQVQPDSSDLAYPFLMCRTFA